MEAIFWVSLALVVYAYAGYAVWLSVQARLRTRPVQTGAIFPTVSVVIAAHNEATTLPQKLRSLSSQTYPSELIQVVIASDGSTDATNALLQTHSDQVTAVVLPQPGGKAVALNHAVHAATGEILVFMDARQTVDPSAIEQLVSRLADPTVGAVSGELHLETEHGEPSPDALGIYWKIEKTVRRLESATGSVVGVTGAIFAMRRNLFLPLPPGTLLDDVLTPMNVARAGYRVLFCDAAVARDRIFVQSGKEFGRKVRTLTGNYQLLQLAPWLLTPADPLLFRLISHKLLRLVVPLLLLMMLLSAGLAAGTFYHAAFGLQLAMYLLAVLGAISPAARRFRAISIVYTFAMLNVAASMAFYNFITGRARWA